MVFERVESGVGAFFTSIVSIGIAGILSLVLYDLRSGRPWEFGLVVMALMVWLALDLPAMLRWWNATRHGQHPAAVVAALKHPRLPLILRPLAALWWLGHFAWGLLLITATHFTDHAKDAPDDPAGVKVLLLFMTWCYCLAANGYLALAVAAMTRSPAAVHHVWARRWFIDLAATLLAAFSLFIKPLSF